MSDITTDVALLRDVYNNNGPSREAHIELPGRYEDAGVKFYVRTLSSSEWYEIRKESIDTKTGLIDYQKRDTLFLEKCMVNYNPKSVEIRELYSANSSEEVLDMMFMPGELTKFLNRAETFAINGKIPEKPLKK